MHKHKSHLYSCQQQHPASKHLKAKENKIETKGSSFVQTVLLIHNISNCSYPNKNPLLLFGGNTYAHAPDSRSTLPLHLPTILDMKIEYIEIGLST